MGAIVTVHFNGKTVPVVLQLLSAKNVRVWSHFNYRISIQDPHCPDIHLKRKKKENKYMALQERSLNNMFFII